MNFTNEKVSLKAQRKGKNFNLKERKRKKKNASCNLINFPFSVVRSIKYFIFFLLNHAVKGVR